jgi:hypothetical protein
MKTPISQESYRERTFVSLDQPKNKLSDFDLHFLKNDSLGMRCASERIGLPACSQMSLLVILVGPTLVTSVDFVFASSSDSAWFT